MPFCDVTLAARKPQNSAYPEKLLTLGDHLRKKRLDLGLYQKDVAVAIGVDTTTIYNWENNRTSPPVRFIHRVVEFLGHGPPDLKSVSLGERIKRYRYLKGITQKELARQIGIDPTTLRRLEGNQGRCLESVRRKVANLLGRGIPSSQSKRRHL